MTTTGSGAGAVERSELPNGLVVCTEFVPGVRSIALGVWVRTGSVHERREEMGISHLLEHLVFKGSATRSAHEIALALEARGGALDAYTAREHTVYQAHFLDRDLPVAADLLRDMIFSPLLREEDLELERHVVLDELAQVEDTPDDLVFEHHNEILWGEHPYGYSILGTRASITDMTAAAIRRAHSHAYRPGNVVVAAAGNLTHAQLLEALTGAGWAAVSGAPVRVVDRPEPTPVSARALHVARDLQQAHLVVGSTTIPMSDPSRPAYLVVNTLLGGGMSSRLFQHVRERLGLAYAVYSFHTLYSDVGVHGVYVGTSPENAGRARQAVMEQLDRLANEGIDEKELDVGRQQLVGQYLLSQESVGARMNRLAVRELYGEPFRTVDEVIARIESVTTEDALAVARAWFAPARQTIVEMGPVQAKVITASAT